MELKAPSPDEPTTRRDEAVLVRSARHREEGAIRELVRRHNRYLFRVARAVVASDAAAEDVLQEAWIKGLTSLEGFRGEASFVGWMARITLNEARQSLRRRRECLGYDTVTEVLQASGGVGESSRGRLLAFPAGGNVTEAEAGRRQVQGLLEQAIDALPEPLRLVFVLCEVEGRATREVAELLELNPVTVKTRRFRARHRLRDWLQHRLVGGLDSAFPFAGRRCQDMADRVMRRLQERP